MLHEYRGLRSSVRLLEGLGAKATIQFFADWLCGQAEKNVGVYNTNDDPRPNAGGGGGSPWALRGSD